MSANSKMEESLLFGVMAFQDRLITRDQLSEFSARWLQSPEKPLADLLTESGLLADADRRVLERSVTLALDDRSGQDNAADPAETIAMSREDRTPPPSSTEPQTVEFDSRRTHPHSSHDQSTDAVYSDATAEWQSAGPLKPPWRYSMVREHAEGGLGKVSIAFDTHLRRRVALKEIKPQWRSDDQATRRFLNEARITGQLEHPNIVPVYELAWRPENQQPFYAMRFIEGYALGEAIAAHHRKTRETGREDPLEFRRLLDAFLSVCNAIAYAHNRGVLHRDLKPANIVLGQFGVVVVLDWGLAKILSERESEPASEPNAASAPIQLDSDSQTQTAGVSGTPSYMAPEQAEGRGNLMNERTDVYGLGAILFEILTGRPPIIGQSVSETLRLVIAGDIPRPRTIRNDAPKVLDAICAKAMAKAPEDRYASAEELSEDVRRWLADEPAGVAPDPLSVKVRRWIRKNPALAASAASIVLMAMLAMLSFASIQQRYNGQLKQANEDLTLANLAVARSHGELKQSHEEITKLNAGLTQANQLAEAELDLAMEAIQSFHGEIAEDAVLNNPALEALRFRLLDVPQGFYKRLAETLEASKATKDENQMRLAVALFHLMTINRLKGSAPAAIENGREAIRILEPLASSSGPASLEARSRLASSYNELGVVYQATNQLPEAVRVWDKSLKTLESLTRDDPESAKHRQELAASHNNLASAYQAMDRSQEAEASWGQALKIQLAIVRAHPNVEEHRYELSAFYINMGFLHHTTNRLAEAESFYRDAERLLKTLAEAHPQSEDYQGRLGAVRNNLGFVLQSTNRLQDAEAVWVEALAARESLARSHPTVASRQGDFAATCNNLGYLYQITNRAESAAKSFGKALAILEPLTRSHPHLVEQRVVLSDTYNNLGISQSSINETKKAEMSFRNAAAILSPLMNANPGNPQFYGQFAAIQVNLGQNYERLNRWQQGEKAYRQALRVQKRMAENSAIPLHELQIARTHASLGRVQQRMGRLGEAERAYRTALEIQRRIASQDAAPPVLNALGSTLRVLGELEQVRNHPQEAIASLSEGLKLLEQAAQADPSNEWHQIDWAEGRSSLGSALADRGEPAQALPQFEQAESILKAILSAQPQLNKARSALGVVHARRAAAYNRLARSNEARSERDLARQYDEPPTESVAKTSKAVADAYAGRHSDAVREALTLANDQTIVLEDSDRYNLACVIALSIASAKKDAALSPIERDRLARRYGDEAMAILSRWNPNGKSQDEPMLDLIRTDSELDALRDHAGFIGWIGDLIFPDDPFQHP